MEKLELPKEDKLKMNPGPYSTVNRLIMVGNGFDLAHGLKSRFGDFISSYVNDLLKEFGTSFTYDDELIKINLNYAGAFSGNFSRFITPGNGIESLKRLEKVPEITVNWESSFLKELIHGLRDKNWVDVEVAYFDNLKKFTGYANSRDRVDKLNSDFEIIRTKFLKYLDVELGKLEHEVRIELISQFTSEITTDEVLLKTIKENKPPNHLYFLNFNYTDILSKYLTYIPKYSDFDSGKLQINYIHGQLNNLSEKPIFGFGDEIDRDYEKFEDGRDNNVFKHIKSFKYLETSNYRKLMKFINAYPYQVHIYGHSCGISDRTMLKTIFEHKKCISVKVYYHEPADGTNDFTEKNYSIARHFRNKAMLRDKVVNLEFCDPMYQPI